MDKIKIALIITEPGVFHEEIATHYERYAENIFGTTATIKRYYGSDEPYETIVSKILRTKCTIALVVGNNATMRIKALSSKRKLSLPVIFVCIPNPVTLGLISSLENSRNNFVGVALAKPNSLLMMQIMFLADTSKKNMLVVYQDNYIGMDQQKCVDYFKRFNLTIIPFCVDSIDDHAELSQAIQEHDFVFLIEGSLYKKKREFIAQECKKHRKILRTNTRRAIAQGAIFGLDANFELVVQKAAELSYHIATYHKKPKELHTFELNHTRELIFSPHNAKRVGVIHSSAREAFFGAAFALGKTLENFDQLLAFFTAYHEKEKKKFDAKLARKTEKLLERLSSSKEKAAEKETKQDDFLRKLEAQANRPKRIAVVVTTMDEVQQETLKSCKAYLQKKFPSKVTFTIFEAGGFFTKKTEDHIYTIVKESFDAIYPMGNFVTHIAQYMTKKLSLNIPVIFACTSDPIEKGFIHSRKNSRNNLVGTYVDPPKFPITAKIIMLSFPLKTKFLTIYEPGTHVAKTRYDMERTKQDVAPKGKELTIFCWENAKGSYPSELIEAIKKTDAVFIPEGGISPAAAKKIEILCRSYNIFLWDGTRDLTQHGHVIGQRADFAFSGEINAQEFAEIFFNHKKPTNIESERISDGRHLSVDEIAAAKKRVSFSPDQKALFGRALNSNEDILHLPSPSERARTLQTTSSSLEHQAIRQLKGEAFEYNGPHPPIIFDHSANAKNILKEALSDPYVMELYVTGSYVYRLTLETMKQMSKSASMQVVQFFEESSTLIKTPRWFPTNYQLRDFHAPYPQPIVALKQLYDHMSDLAYVTIPVTLSRNKFIEKFGDQVRDFKKEAKKRFGIKGIKIRYILNQKDAQKVVVESHSPQKGLLILARFCSYEMEKYIGQLCGEESVMLCGAHASLKNSIPLIYGIKVGAFSATTAQTYEHRTSQTTITYKPTRKELYGVYIKPSEIAKRRGGKKVATEEVVDIDIDA